MRRPPFDVPTLHAPRPRILAPRILLLGALCLATTSLSTPGPARASDGGLRQGAVQAGSDGADAPSGPAPVLPPLAGDTLETLASEATAAVVRLDVDTPSGSRQGSGFLVGADGRILTNHHVVEEASGIRVKLASGDVYERVTIREVDERRDIAVLEIPGFDLPTLTLGNSRQVGVGTAVIAIGSPLGLENTVSTGIVSGRRSEPEGYEVLQITAPASQGSSGGPVLAENGQVIGIATSQMRDGQNLNFAVPINYARGLLGHLDGEPVAVLAPDGRTEMSSSAARTSDRTRVNRRLEFDLRRFRGFSLEMEGRVGDDRRRRSRVTYRHIEAVEGEPNIERYAESETTERAGPFDTPRTVRRERSRIIVAADDLRPISVQGEVARWEGGDWHQREYSLRFDGYHVTGTVTDTAGRTREIDRGLPPGIIVRGMRHLAFATLAEDSLVGRSVELVTFDASVGQTTSDRYDVRDTTTIQVAGEEHPALRVNLASGLSNSTAYFLRTVPRALLRRETGPPGAMEEASELRLFGDPGEREDTGGRPGGSSPASGAISSGSYAPSPASGGRSSTSSADGDAGPG
jgi:S1-C subfamily serine protease